MGKQIKSKLNNPPLFASFEVASPSPSFPNLPNLKVLN